MIYERSPIIDIDKDHYKKIYSSNIKQNCENIETVVNVDSEEIPDITMDGIEKALSQLKNGHASGEDGAGEIPKACILAWLS